MGIDDQEPRDGFDGWSNQAGRFPDSSVAPLAGWPEMACYAVGIGQRRRDVGPLADRSIGFIAELKQLAPVKPFSLYLATVAKLCAARVGGQLP